MQRAHQMGITDIDHLYTLDELAQSDDVIFAATGITDGDLLKGPIWGSSGQDLQPGNAGVTGTVRYIEAYHQLTGNRYLEIIGLSCIKERFVTIKIKGKIKTASFTLLVKDDVPLRVAVGFALGSCVNFFLPWIWVSSWLLRSLSFLVPV